MACTSVVSSYPYAHNYISHTLSETFNNPTFTEFQSNTEQFQFRSPAQSSIHSHQQDAIQDSIHHSRRVKNPVQVIDKENNW